MTAQESYASNERKDDIPYSFRSIRIKSFQSKDALEQHDRRSIRYHYTSSSALMAILDTKNMGNGAVRFTDSRYMNDRSEHMFFIKRLLEFMDKFRGKYPFCQEVINELLLQKHSPEDYISLKVSDIDVPRPEETKTNNPSATNILSRLKSRHFLFCLCNDSDSLHMWNYYIHNGNYQGYNIGIRIYDFLRIFDNDDTKEYDPIRFFCGDVLYKQKDQEKEIEELCRTIEGYDRGNTSSGEDESDLEIGMVILWLYIQSYGLFFKDESFSDEKEYRIVIQYNVFDNDDPFITNPRSKKTDVEYSFFERNGILVPCLKVPLTKEAVRQITLAPILESQIATSSIHEFLESNGYFGVDVKQSSIPIRY